MTSGRTRGSQPLGPRDWIFGSRPRRLLIERALSRRAPRRGWSKTELADMAGVSPNGGVDEHVEGLRLLGALEQIGSRWRPPVPRPEVTKALLRLLRELPPE